MQTYIEGFEPEVSFISCKTPRVTNLETFIKRQKEFSSKAFGEGKRTLGIIDHIKKELLEIQQKPLDVEEWCDVVILALDGAWRTGCSPEEICNVLRGKQNKNIQRKWPESTSEDVAIEHIKE
jgi:hypothetical protein